MQINKNRKGLALGAVFALVASLFVGTAPAQASENAVVTYPATGEAAETTMLITEDFDLDFRFGTGVNSVYFDYTAATAAAFGVVITKPAGTTVSRSVTYSTGVSVAKGNLASGTEITGTTIDFALESSRSPKLSLSLADKTSVSAAVSITVQAFLDLNRDGVLDAGEPVGNSVTVNFVPWSAMAAAVSVIEPVASQTSVSGTLSVTEGNINLTQLDGPFNLGLESTRDGAASASNIAVSDLVSATNVSASNVATGNYSASNTVVTAELTTSGTVQSVSAIAKYQGVQIAKVTVAVTARSIAGLTMSPVVGANLKANDATSANARYNSAFTLNAFAHTTSQTTSMAVARAFTVSSFVGIELDADSGVVIAGTTYTTSAGLASAGLTLAAGTNTVAISTFGQEYDASDNIVFKMTSQLQEDTYTVHFVEEALTVDYTATTAVVSAAGASRTFVVEVEDQWGETTVRPDLRVVASVNLGGSVSDSVSATVADSKATLTVAPVPAARTGSATVTFTLEYYAPNSRAWTFMDNDTETWNVFSYAAGSDEFTSRTVSVSGTISYGVVAYSWSDTVNVKVKNSFSDVVVSAPGLVIQNADLLTQTASETLTVAGNGQNVNVKFAGPKAGTFTVTFTNGTDVTTSEVVIAAAADDAGASITFDTTAIPAGSTKVITGTLVDANGNPVHTSGSATILVTYTVTGNAGIPIGTMPTETDADGEFTITVLTGANDSGTAVVSATYYKNGASTAVADVLTFNQSIVVGGAATAPASDQKLTVGSFKGFVAIYALNYTGQKLSAKVAGKWLVVEDLTRFQRVVRNTGAGFTIKVDLYIDGALVRSETVVTK